MIRRVFLIFYANAITAHFLESFREFPSRQKPATFSIDQAVEKLNALAAAD
jgi:arylsulfatase